MSTLRSRWESGVGREFADKLLRVGYSGNGFQIVEVPFGFVEESGRMDLRGLMFQKSAILRRVSLKGADLTEAGFTSARLEGCQFDDVSFDRARLQDVTELGNRFNDCSFQNTNLDEAILGYRGSKFNSCVFRKAKFRKALFVRGEFTDCIFDSCALDGCDFNGSSFEKCTFIGTLRSVWFRGTFPLECDSEKYGTPRLNLMKGVSFENAKLSWPTFSDHCDLSTVIAPNDGRYVVFDRWAERLEWVRECARWWPEELRGEAERFVGIYETHAKKQAWYLMPIDDLIEQMSEAAAERVWETLHDFKSGE